jgi:hypothetical protein
VLIAGLPMSVAGALLILWMGRYPDAPEPIALPTSAAPVPAE